MIIGLIFYCKNADIVKHAVRGCSEIITNAQKDEQIFNNAKITYEPCTDAIVERADYVIIVCDKHTKRVTSTAAKCLKYYKSVEVVAIT